MKDKDVLTLLMSKSLALFVFRLTSKNKTRSRSSNAPGCSGTVIPDENRAMGSGPHPVEMHSTTSHGGNLTAYSVFTAPS